MKIDYKNAEQPTSVAPGEYDVVVCAWDVQTSKTSGNPCIVLDYEVRKDIDQPFAGFKVRYDNFTFIDSCAWRFSQAAKAAGVPDGYELRAPEDFGRVMHHRNLRIVVDQVERNGKKYASVKAFAVSKNPIGQPQLPPVPDANGFTPADYDVSDEDLPFN